MSSEETRTDLAAEMTPEQSAAFMESALKAQIAVLKRERDPSLPPVTYTDAKGEQHVIDGFISMIHTRSGNLFQGYHLNSMKLCSMLDTVMGTMAERDPDLLRSFLTQMIMEHLPDSVSPKARKAYELMKTLSAFADDDHDSEPNDDSKTNEGETK